MKVLILAGGKGTRYMEETLKMPKPMIPLLNKPMIFHIMEHYISYDYKDLAAQIDWISFLPNIPISNSNELMKLDRDIYKILNTPKNLTPIMVENEDFMKRKTYLFDRGSWLNKKEEVNPQVPSILNKWDLEWKKID